MTLLHQTTALVAPSSKTTSPVIAWVYLLLITAAELVTSVVDPLLGLLVHVGLLVVLLLHGALAHDVAHRALLLALTLAPLLRMLSLSMPLLRLPQAAWYPLVSIPLFVALWIIVREGCVTRYQLGLQRGNLMLQLMLVGLGLGLGALEYAILQPEPMLATFNWQPLVLASLSLLLFTGFMEEIVFRGLLQSLAIPMLGRTRAIVFVALLFAVLHIGYLSVIDVFFVFGVGIVFGYIVSWTGSILGVTLAHGLTNITLFLLMPYLAAHPADPLAMAAPWAIGTITVLSLLTSSILIYRTRHVNSVERLSEDPGTIIRTLRRRSGLTYTELAYHTGLSVRDLAAIEHGIEPLQLEQIAPLAHGLIPRLPQQDTGQQFRLGTSND